jgi:predicted PurR-regulated permease PerM
LPKKTFWLKTAIVLVLLYAASQVMSVYLPIVLAMVISFVLNPLVNFLCVINIPLGRTKHHHIPRSIAVLISFLIAGTLIFTIAAFVLSPFMREFASFVKDLPELLKKLHITLISLNERFIHADIPDNIRATITRAFSETVMYLASLTTQFLTRLLQFATTAIELIVTPVLAYYFLKDWRKIKTAFLSLFSITLRPRANALLKETGLVIGHYIKGQIVISIIMGVMVFGGMSFMGVEYPLILAVFAALTETIPILGPIIGAIPALFLSYLISPILTLKVLIFYIVVHQIETNIIIPNIMGKAINLHPAAIILSILAGAHLFGVVGMVLAVPVTAVLKIFLKHLWRYEG